MVSSSWPALAPRDGVVERGADGELEAVGAKLNYHGPGVALVRTRRDASGSDATLEGARWLASREVSCPEFLGVRFPFPVPCRYSLFLRPEPSGRRGGNFGLERSLQERFHTRADGTENPFFPLLFVNLFK